MLPGRLYDSMDRMKYASTSLKRHRSQATIEDIASPWTDNSKTPVASFFTDDASRSLNGLWLYRDPAISEVLLFDENEELTDVLQHVNAEDRKRIQYAIDIRISYDSRFHEFKSRRTFNLTD